MLSWENVELFKRLAVGLRSFLREKRVVEPDLLESARNPVLGWGVDSLDLLPRVDEAHKAERGMKSATNVRRLDPVAGISTQNCRMENIAFTR